MSNKSICYNKNNIIILYAYLNHMLFISYVICILYICTKFKARHTNYE